MSMAEWALGPDGDYAYAAARKASACLPTKHIFVLSGHNLLNFKFLQHAFCTPRCLRCMRPFRGLAYPTHCAFSMYQYWDHGEAELASGECLSLRQVAGPTTVVTALPSCMLKCLQLGSWETSTIHQQMASVISAKSWVCKKQGVDLMFKTGRVCQLEWRTLWQATNACFTQGTVTSLKRFMNHEESL